MALNGAGQALKSGLKAQLTNLKPEENALETLLKPLKGTAECKDTYSFTTKPVKVEDCSTPSPKDYSHLIRIGEGSKPSPEFVEKAQKSITELMNSLPEDLRELALKQDFGIKVYHSPHDYMKKLEDEGIEAILPESDLQLMKKTLEDMRPTLKEQLQKMVPEEEITDEFIDDLMKNNAETFQKQLLEQRAGCKAYYNRGYQNIILHEKPGSPELNCEVTDPTPELFQHEIGHYFDYSRPLGDPAFSSDSKFRLLLQEDLENAYQSKNPAFSLIKNEKGQLRLSESERLKIQQNNLKHLEQQGTPQHVIEMLKQQKSPALEGANYEHFAYYAPVDELEPLNERKTMEAFAEIFAGLVGNGSFQKGCLAKDLYPKTAEYMQNNILPEIGSLPPLKKGHNGF
jgi:hypothetical protein